ncbi:MAG: molybdenum cofactor biosynthesis protein B [Halobacteriales archaeon]
MVDFHERETRSGHDSLDEEELREPDPEADDAPAADDHAHAGHHDDETHHHAHDLETLGAAVVTISSTRSLDEDPSGDAIVAAFESDGHEIAIRELLGDDLDGIQGRVDALVGRQDVDVVVTTGGTGVTPDDVTVEAVQPLFEKRLPGFGELFRRRSEAEIGTRIVGTRAIGGIADGVPVFCLPGSENAAQLGATEIILPEAGHLAGLARRDETEE